MSQDDLEHQRHPPFFMRPIRSRGKRRQIPPAPSSNQYHHFAGGLPISHVDEETNWKRRSVGEECMERNKWPRIGGEHTEIDNGDSPDVAVEVEVDIEEEEEGNERCEIEQKRNERRIVVISPVKDFKPSPTELMPPSNHHRQFHPTSSINSSENRRQCQKTIGRGGMAQYTAQQLIRFDPMQCFDIDELRARMVAAQRRIEDSASLHLNNNKLKNENLQLREELAVNDHRIGVLESTVLERNERLKELLKENVFMRAQIKKIQNEFGLDAVKEVFNRSGNCSQGERRIPPARI